MELSESIKLSSRTKVAVSPSLACAETTSSTRWKELWVVVGGGFVKEGGGEKAEIVYE